MRSRPKTNPIIYRDYFAGAEHEDVVDEVNEDEYDEEEAVEEPLGNEEDSEEHEEEYDEEEDYGSEDLKPFANDQPLVKLEQDEPKPPEVTSPEYNPLINE